MQLKVGILVSVSGGFYFSKKGERVMTFKVFLLKIQLGEKYTMSKLKCAVNIIGKKYAQY